MRMMGQSTIYKEDFIFDTSIWVKYNTIKNFMNTVKFRMNIVNMRFLYHRFIKNSSILNIWF